MKNFNFKGSLLNLAALSLLLLGVGCTTEDESLQTDLESTSSSNWSTKSVELQVVSITAGDEQSENPATNAIDNDPESRWSGYGDPINLILDLGSVNLVDYINIAFHKGDERTNYFQVFMSTNGSSWTLKNRKTSNGKTESLQLFDLSNTEARYVRLKCFGNSNSDWNSITDIEVYGTKNEIVEPPFTDPPTGGDDVASLLIGDLWKITMPYDKNGNDSGNVSDPDDRNRNAYEYYDLNQASSDYPNNLYVSGGEVFFVAHCGGATTSGSIYPRCELRQLDSNGNDDLISFSKDQYLDVTVRAVKTPVEKPEVCMVQLKGSSSNEIIRVDFTKDSQGLHLTENESTTRDNVIGYDLGDRLRVRITLDSSQVRLQLNNLDNGDTYDKTWSHKDDEGYFKVGSYVQSATTFCEEKNKSSSECTDDKADAVGIVAVSNLTYKLN